MAALGLLFLLHAIHLPTVPFVGVDIALAGGSCTLHGAPNLQISVGNLRMRDMILWCHTCSRAPAFSIVREPCLSFIARYRTFANGSSGSIT
jgi:hypothetical protein